MQPAKNLLIHLKNRRIRLIRSGGTWSQIVMNSVPPVFDCCFGISGISFLKNDFRHRAGKCAFAAVDWRQPQSSQSSQTHLFNFFTSPAESQVFPLIQRSPLFVLLGCGLWKLVPGWTQLHLDRTTPLSDCLSVKVPSVMLDPSGICGRSPAKL